MTVDNIPLFLLTSHITGKTSALTINRRKMAENSSSFQWDEGCDRGPVINNATTMIMKRRNR